MALIKKYKTTIAERKDIENALAVDEERDALLEYVIACDHPEAYEFNEEIDADE